MIRAFLIRQSMAPLFVPLALIAGVLAGHMWWNWLDDRYERAYPDERIWLELIGLLAFAPIAAFLLRSRKYDLWFLLIAAAFAAGFAFRSRYLEIHTLDLDAGGKISRYVRYGLADASLGMIVPVALYVSRRSLTLRIASWFRR